MHLIHLDGEGEPAGIVTRNVVVVEEGASLTLFESYAGLGGRVLQRNAVTEVVVGDKGAIDHIKLQREGEGDRPSLHLARAARRRRPLWRLPILHRCRAFPQSDPCRLRRRRLVAEYLRRAF